MTEELNQTPPEQPVKSSPPDGLLTLEELAEVTNNTKILHVRVALGGRTTKTRIAYSAAHRAAAALHGWDAHALHTTEPVRLTIEAYKAALETAMLGKEPHAEAVSKFAPKFKPHTPKGHTPPEEQEGQDAQPKRKGNRR